MRPLTCALILVITLLALSCKDNVLVIDDSANKTMGKVSLQLDNAPAEISLVTARLSRPNFHDLIISLNISDSGRSAHGTFENVALGVWHLRVDAYNDSNLLRYTGETDIDVFPGDTTRVNLELLPASGTVEIHVSWGSNFIISPLVLYLQFDGTLRDSSGNGNDGTATNPQYTTDPWGNPNSAYLFNGADNYITVANSPSINPAKQLTITMWLRVDSIVSNYMPVVYKGGPLSGYYFNNREYGVWTKYNISLWYPEFKSAGDGQGMHELDSDHHSYTPGQWNFFAFIVDRVNHRMQIYADGVLTEQTSDSYSSFNVNPYPLIIGWSEENLFEHTPLRGAMDNLRIYNRALSPARIQYLYSFHK